MVIAVFFNILYVYMMDGDSMKDKHTTHKIGKFTFLVIVTYMFNVLNSISASVMLEGTYFYQISNTKPGNGIIHFQALHL
ncbi:hypothetical protein HMPREF2528_03335 [Rothia sp. HMSC078H08]|nr:hypothetical protein HMPREF2528_03335 [Rothia sp. HMSC078H08]